MTKDKSPKDPQRLYERTRDELAASTRSASESYDRALLTLSSAFLGGSLAFIKGLIPLEKAVVKWTLYAAWLCFALTIVLTLWSFVYGLFGYKKLRDAADRYYLRGEQDAWKVSETIEREVHHYVVACGVSFIAGIVLLVAFVLVNLMRG